MKFSYERKNRSHTKIFDERRDKGRTAAGPHKGGGGDKLGHELALRPIGSSHGCVEMNEWMRYELVDVM